MGVRARKEYCEIETELLNFIARGVDGSGATAVVVTPASADAATLFIDARAHHSIASALFSIVIVTAMDGSSCLRRLLASNGCTRISMARYLVHIISDPYMGVCSGRRW